MTNSESQQILPLLVSPAELAESISLLNANKNICIVDLSTETNYLQGHIPGAVFLPYQSLISGTAPAPGKLPDTERLVEIFNYLEKEENTHFVVCDDEGGGWAGRFIWTLDVIGHKKYSYIDGGMLAWKKEGLVLETGQGQQKAQNKRLNKINIDRSPIAELKMIAKDVGKERFVVWDARSPEEYSGSKIFAAKGGHIPGAINVEWTSLMDADRNYKIRKDAKEFLAKLGIDGSLPIITHCQTHHRSGFTYLVGKTLGYDICAYDGSWAEWGNHPDTPVEI